MDVTRVLVVTGDYTYKEDIQREALLKRDLNIDYAKKIDEVSFMLDNNDYVMVVIRAETENSLPILNEIKRVKPSIPILVYSYVDDCEQNAKLNSMEIKASIYLASPLSRDYIIESAYALAQIFTNSKNRYETAQPTFLTYGYVRVCIDSRQVFVKGKLVELQRREYDVLCLLMQNHGKVLYYSEILRQLWGEDFVDSSVNNLSSIVYRLKKKLTSVEPGTRTYIKNAHNSGYSFDP